MEVEDEPRRFKLGTSEEEAGTRCLSRIYCHLLHRSPGRPGGRTYCFVSSLFTVHSYDSPRREGWDKALDPSSEPSLLRQDPAET